MTRGDEATTALNKDFSLTVVNNTNDKYSYANDISRIQRRHRMDLLQQTVVAEFINPG